MERGREKGDREWEERKGKTTEKEEVVKRRDSEKGYTVQESV